MTTTTTKTDVVMTYPYGTIHPTPAHEERKGTLVYEKPAFEVSVYTPKETPVDTPEYDETVTEEPKEEPAYTPKPTAATYKSQPSPSTFLLELLLGARVRDAGADDAVPTTIQCRGNAMLREEPDQEASCNSGSFCT